jgi:hypothetical protein
MLGLSLEEFYASLQRAFHNTVLLYFRCAYIRSVPRYCDIRVLQQPSQWPSGLIHGLRQLKHWNRGFESNSRLGCLGSRKWEPSKANNWLYSHRLQINWVFLKKIVDDDDDGDDTYTNTAALVLSSHTELTNSTAFKSVSMCVRTIEMGGGGTW